MTVSKEHRERIKRELIKAGATTYGLLKGESRFLPNLVHEDEHIKGVVYGPTKGASAMLVATDKRVIYLDKKLTAVFTDVLPYDVIAGVNHSQEGPFASVILHTRIGNYTISFANINCADTFVRYIEKRRLETQERPDKPPVDKPALVQKADDKPLNEAGRQFLRTHETAVLSTIDRSGNVQSAVVYYRADTYDRLFILTKSETAKARNILTSGQVAITIYDEPRLETLQLQGIAELEADETTRQWVFTEIARPRMYQGESSMPPVTTMQQGAYVVIRITPYNAKYSNYKAGSTR